ncbi:MAG: hypothetical protein KDI51_20790, partial [Xanthomonadales bacterium]|nr:hypothetical protein [Xanthomonadales bacterium]
MVNPALTVLDGSNAVNSGLSFVFDAGQDVRFESLSWTRFDGDEVLRMDMDIQGHDSGAATVRNCRFLGNGARQIIRARVPRLELVDNLIAGNTLAGPERAAVLGDSHSNFNAFAIITNNTIANNSGAPGLMLRWDESSDRVGEIANNIIWGNGTPDIDLSAFNHANTALILSSNVYASVSNPGPLASNNLVANPLFVNAGAGNYALSPSSPAVNSGVGFQLYGTPSVDLVGNQRIIG